MMLKVSNHVFKQKKITFIVFFKCSLHYKLFFKKHIVKHCGFKNVEINRVIDLKL